MTLNPSQLINNIKRSFNRYIEQAVSPSLVNYDQDPFDTEGLMSWYSVRYTEFSSRSAGAGELVADGKNTKGRIHELICEVGAWRRGDPQRLALGDMIDTIISACEPHSIILYDYSDPQSPVECGLIRLRPLNGRFAPAWGVPGFEKKVEDSNLVGFVLGLSLTVITEVEP